ncbi:Carboxypeptidase A6 [Manis javanica]|nr:Carboxypeptidase A6 [Manis javanica]
MTPLCPFQGSSPPDILLRILHGLSPPPPLPVITSDSGAAGGGRGLDPKQAHHVAACRTQSSCHPASKTKVGPLPSECPTQPACVPWPVAASRKITQTRPPPGQRPPQLRGVPEGAAAEQGCCASPPAKQLRQPRCLQEL